MSESYEDARSAALIPLRRISAPTDEQIRTCINGAIALLPGADVDADALFADVRQVFAVTSEEYQVLQDNDPEFKPWLLDAKADIKGLFWDRYKNYLLVDRDLPPDTVNQLDRITNSVLGLLSNPTKTAGPSEQDRRGMVVGHVQSGKTGNYTGLICKAVDAGYRMIIVLTGTTSDLRSQTQARIDEGFIGWKTAVAGLNATRVKNDKDNYIGVGTDPRRRGLPYILYTLTDSGPGGDFNAAAARRNGIDVNVEIPVIAVVKKNGPILKKLINWLSDRAKDRAHGPGLMISNLPCLIIDDEADYASVNTKKEKKESTTINSSIRTLLQLFKTRSYVGYTATPFANIYISNDDEPGALPFVLKNVELPLGPDLFPRHFIINIPAPSNYIGPHRIFGLTEAGDDTVLPALMPISDYAEQIPDVHKKDSPLPQELPASMHKAVRCYIIGCAIRRARRQEGKHNAMLVHVSRFTRWQDKMAVLLNELLEDYQTRLKHNAASIFTELRTLFEAEYVGRTAQVAALTGLYHDPKVRPLTWDELRPYLHEAAARMEVRAIHGRTTVDHSSPIPNPTDPLLRALDYAEADRTGQVLSVIAVGGDKLSRGFTLEGLSVSYYLRASKMYDTLMQMGRWFGYRPGYADLCRLFTTTELAGWYRHITLAMEEMRNQFDLLSALNRTPAEYGLRVRTLPGVLQITAANKRRTGQRMFLSYSGTVEETYVFALDAPTIARNMLAGQKLVAALGAPDAEAPASQPYRWSAVEPGKVLDFIGDYRARQATLIRELLAQYIQDQQPESLTEWTVVLTKATRDGAAPAPFTINGASVDVPTLLRTEATDQAGDYKLKNARILSPGHEALDLTKPEFDEALAETQARQQPGAKLATRPSGVFIRKNRSHKRGLLLLYPLDPAGCARATPGSPLLGYAICFPSLTDDQPVEYLVVEHFFKYPELGGGLEEEEEETDE